MKDFNIPKTILSIFIPFLFFNRAYAENKYDGYTTQECIASNLSKVEEEKCFNQARYSSSEENSSSIEMQTTGNMAQDSALFEKSDYLTKGANIVRLYELAKLIYIEQLVNGNTLVTLTNTGYVSNGDKAFKYLEQHGVKNKWIAQLVVVIMFNAIKISEQYQQDPLWSKQEFYYNLILPILDKLMFNELQDRGFEPSDYINQ